MVTDETMMFRLGADENKAQSIIRKVCAAMKEKGYNPTNQLVGYIDSISNGVTDAYIQDLMIRPDHQGKGIGTDLINKMIRCLKEKHIYMISVVFEESLKPFYDKFGFNSMLCGQMETYLAD